MKNIFRIFGSDVSHLVRNFFAFAIALGLCVIPSLYAWFNIYSNWDPYANTGNIRIAIVNHDEGDAEEGVNMGNNILENLRENKKIGWTETDDEDAMEGVYSGKYYAAVIIDDNFTDSMLHAFSDTRNNPTIRYYENEKRNAVATKITDTAVGTLKQNINEQFISAVIREVFSSTGELAKQIEEEDDLEKVEDSVHRLRMNIEAYSALVDVLGEKSFSLQDTLTNNTERLENSKEKIASGQQKLEEASGKLDQEKRDLVKQNASSYEEQLKTELELVKKRMDNLQADMDRITSSVNLEDAKQAMIDAMMESVDLYKDLEDLRSLIELLRDVDDLLPHLTADNAADVVERGNTIAQSINDILNLQYDLFLLMENLANWMGLDILVPLEEFMLPTLSEEQIAALHERAADFDEWVANKKQEARQRTDEAIDTAEDINEYVQETGREKLENTDLHFDPPEIQTLNSLKQAMNESQASLSGIKALYNDSLAPNTNATLDSLQGVISSVSVILGSLNTTVTDFGNLTTMSGETLATTDLAFAQLKKVLNDTDQKLIDLEDKIHYIKDGKVVDMILGVLQGDPDSFGEFFASPVAVETVEVYPIKNYGSGMTPFYSILAIWVGGTILTALIKVKVDKNVAGDATPAQQYFGRYLLYFVLGQIQALVIVLGDIYLLHCQILDPLRFYFVAALASFTFTLFIYSLAVALGDIGKALAVVIMVLQIAGSGGTFPIELLPEVYRKIYIFFPFPYAINAMRETIGGAFEWEYLKNCLILLIFVAVALVVGLLVRIPLMGLNEYVEERMEDTKML